MYTELQIKRFRGIASLAMTGLQRVNLILGPNNVGKSTVLEALFLLGDGTSPIGPSLVGRLRGQRLGDDSAWRSLFSAMNPVQPIELSARWSGEPMARSLRVQALQVSKFADAAADNMTGDGAMAATQEFRIGGLQLSYSPARGKKINTHALLDPSTGVVNAPATQRADFFRTGYLSARSFGLDRQTQQFSHLVRIKQHQEIIDALKLIEPRIAKIEVLDEGSAAAVYVDIGLASLVPLAVSGEGMVRLFSLLMELTASRHGVLLVDEIDNGLHYSAMRRIWPLLDELSQHHEVQIFATTHNDELVRDALQYFGGQNQDLGFFRLDRDESGRHRAVAYDREMQEAVLRVPFEVRG